MGRKTAWFLVLCLAMVLLLGTSVIASEQNDAGSGRDASNEREGAYPLTPGTFTGFLDRVDRYDWYKIDLEQGQILSIDFTVPETAMLSLHLYRGTSYSSHVASLQRVVGQTNTIQYAAGHRETCYIEVARISGGEYQLNINVKNQNDAGSGQDASNEREGAYPLKAGTFTGFLEDADEEDWYKIEDLGRGAIVSVNLAVPETANFDLYLDPSGQQTIVRSTYGAGQDEAIHQCAVGQEAGTCYIRVVLRDGKGEYQLTLDVKNQNDAGSGQDASNEEEGAYPLTPGTYSGFLKHFDDVDYYEINVMKGQIISINLTVPETADFDLFPSIRDYYMPEDPGTGQDEAIQYVFQQSGPRYIRVFRDSGEGEYQLTIEVQNQNDAGTGQDVSDEREGAYPLTLGTLAGFLMPGDNVDWYKIDLEQGQLLSIDFTVPEAATFSLYLYRASGWGPLTGGRYSGGTHDKAIHHVVSEDTWYIKVGRRDGEGEYTLTVRSQAPNPQLPTPDGVSIPFLKKDPSVASGSSCRGACGSGCPDTCQDRPPIVRCFPDPNDANAHLFLTYSSVIECGTHDGCREHDACFDRCAEDGEESVVGPCHDVCSAAIVTQYGATLGASWYLGYGPYDGYLLFSEPPVWSESNPGRVEYTEYRVRVATGDLGLLPRGEGTNAGVYLTLLGTLFGRPQCSSAEIELDTPNYNDFEAGNHEYFVVTAERFDSVDGIVLRHDNTGSYPGWYVDDLFITSLSTGTTWRVDVHRWLALDEEDERLRVEFSTTLAE